MVLRLEHSKILRVCLHFPESCFENTSRAPRSPSSACSVCALPDPFPYVFIKSREMAHAKAV